jgi:hypothetical protein
VTAVPGERLTGSEVGAVDKTCYRQLPRSQPYPQDNTEGRFGAKTGPNLDTLADTLAAVNVAYLPVWAALAELEQLFRDYFAECDRIFASLEAHP